MKNLKIILALAIMLVAPAYAATLSGVNRTLSDAIPSSKIGTRDQQGRVRVLYDEYTLAAELTGQDVIKLMKIPAGAKVYDVILQSPQLGSGGGNGALSVGIQASSLHSADSQLFASVVEAGSAAIDYAMSSDQSVAGNASVFNDEVQVVITADETSDAGIGDKIKLWIYYVKD